MRISKLLAFACAVACVSGVYAENLDWFSGSVCSTNNADFNSPIGVTVENGEFKLDNDIGSALKLTPNATEPALSDGIVVVETKAKLFPSDLAGLPTQIEGARSGFTLAVNALNVTNFYGYIGNREWKCLTGEGVSVPEGEVETSFKIVLNYRDGKVSFFVKKDEETYGVMKDASDITEFDLTTGDTSTVQSVDCFGYGKLTSITANVEKAVAAVTIGDTTKKYGSVAEALANQGAGVVKDVAADGTVKDPETSKADNGLLAWQNDALNIANNETIQLEPAQHTDNAINLKLKNSPDDGIAVSFKVKKADGTYVKEGSGDNSNDAVYPSNSISIPLGTGKYTIEPVFSAAQQQ